MHSLFTVQSQTQPGRSWRAYASNDITFLLFTTACLSGVGQLMMPASFGFGGGWEMVAVARNLARDGSFGNPFLVLPTGPTAAVPPLYPLFLAGLMKLFGETFFANVAVLINILANGVLAALLPYLSSVLFGTRLPGVYAAILSFVSYTIIPNWDVALTSPAIVAFCVISHRLWGRLKPMLWGLILGISLGLLALLNPSSLLVCVPWLAFLAVRLRLQPGQIARGAIGIALGACALTLPWIVRNQLVLGEFAIKGNFGLVLYASSQDCSGASAWENQISGCDDIVNPNKSQAEAERILQIGEHAYDEERLNLALDWIRRHPKRYLTLTLQRVVEFWFPVVRPPAAFAYGIWLVTVLSLFGAVLAIRDKKKGVLYILSVWAIYPLIYYAIVSDSRYLHPILWVSLLAAGYAVNRALAGMSKRKQRRSTA